MAYNRILVVVDDAFDFPEREVPVWVIDELQNASEVSVIAPALGSRLSVAADDDAPARRASERLSAVIRYMESIGLRPKGLVSREGPKQAVETFLLDHEVDRILIGATLDGHWRERGLLPSIQSITKASIACLQIAHHHR